MNSQNLVNSHCMIKQLLENNPVHNPGGTDIALQIPFVLVTVSVAKNLPADQFPSPLYFACPCDDF